MTLAEYLKSHEISDEVFAEKIGVSRSTVNRLRRGARGQLPSRITIEAIARVTDGKVTANDFWLRAA